MLALPAPGELWLRELPAGRFELYAPEGRLVAVAEEEPWAEPPPADRGLLARLLRCLVRRAEPTSRLVARRSDDGRPFLALCYLAPVFCQSVRVYDGDDRLAGYCVSHFKSSLRPDSFRVVHADRKPFGEVRRGADGAYRLTTVGGAEAARVAEEAPGEGFHIRLAQGEAAPPVGALFGLAAAVVIARSAGSAAPPGGARPSA